MPRVDISFSPRRAAAPALAAVALVATLVATVAGLTPAPLIVTVCVLLTASLAPTVGWVQAIALAPLGLVATFLSLGQVYPDVDAPWADANTTVLGVVGAVALVSLLRAGRIPPIPREARWLVIAALSVPLACIAWLTAVRATASSPKLAWLMNNDSAFNVFTSRHILLDGGVDPAKHPSPAPGMSEIAALFTAPGRSGVARSALLEHDVERILQALVLATGALSVFGALGAVLVVRRGHLLPRVAVAVAVAALPWTWYLFGYATHYGFWNAILSSAVLAAAWLAFAERRRHPTAASAAQALAGTALLPLWAPLLLAPAFFALVIVVQHHRAHLALRRWALTAWLAPVLLLGWYLAFVLAPLLGGDTGALAADGAMLAISRTNIVVVLLAASALGLLVHARREHTGELAGPLVLLAAGLVGLDYLVGLRADAPTGPWGYYPAKFGWLLAFLALLAAARAAVALALPPVAERTDVDTSARSRLAAVGRRLAAASAPILAVSVLAAQVPPADPRPVTTDYPTPVPTPDWRLASVWPLLSLSKCDGSSAMDPAVATLLELSSPDEKRLLTRYQDDVSQDGLVNFWLISQPVVQDRNDVRWYAYFLEPDNPQSLCDLATTWGPGVELLTRDRAWGQEIQRTCPDAGIELVVQDPDVS
jgi:hypothetical protein